MTAPRPWIRLTTPAGIPMFVDPTYVTGAVPAEGGLTRVSYDGPAYAARELLVRETVEHVCGCVPGLGG